MHFFSKLLPALCFISLISTSNSSEHRYDEDSKKIEDFEAKRPIFIKLPVGFLDKAVNLEVGTPIELMNKRYGTFDENTVIEHAKTGIITVVTNFNKDARYQLESKRILVTEEDTIVIPYKIVVYPGSKVALGLLNTKRNGWYGNELAFDTGTHKGIYWKKVSKGETETSLVFLNYHFINPGSSTFTIERIGIYKQKS